MRSPAIEKKHVRKRKSPCQRFLECSKRSHDDWVKDFSLIGSIVIYRSTFDTMTFFKSRCNRRFIPNVLGSSNYPNFPSFLFFLYRPRLFYIPRRFAAAVSAFRAADGLSQNLLRVPTAREPTTAPMFFLFLRGAITTKSPINDFYSFFEMEFQYNPKPSLFFYERNLSEWKA